MAHRERTLVEVTDALARLAPLELAQSWDNVGLLAGDPQRTVRRVLLCIDLTDSVVTEAMAAKSDLIVAYHPPIFKPVSRLTASSDGPEANVFRAVASGIAVYALHTALDAANGGTNDVMARLCGVKHVQPLVYVDDPARTECKVVVFVPPAAGEVVADAMFAAGAGRIGEYERCSFRIPGTGTFRGSDASNPTIGRAGRDETVEELRIESVVPTDRIAAVVEALRGAHPYEEPAFDVYPLRSPPRPGIGRLGELRRPITLVALARKLRRATGAAGVQIVGDAFTRITRVIVVVGAAGSLPFRIPPAPGDAIVTGEIRHHDALTILRRGTSAIALGHWASERPVLDPLAKGLDELLRSVSVDVSAADCDPFAAV